MFSLLTFFLGLIINLSKSKKQLLAQISLQQKELEILKRHYRKKRVRFVHSDRIILSILNKIGYIKDQSINCKAGNNFALAETVNQTFLDF